MTARDSIVLRRRIVKSAAAPAPIASLTTFISYRASSSEGAGKGEEKKEREGGCDVEGDW